MTDTTPAWPRFAYDSISSTMDVAEQLARSSERDVFWVTARHQHSGRGRDGRVWHDDPDAAFLATLAVRRGSDWDPLDPLPGTLALRAAAALVTALEGHCAARRLAVKWPNDIVVDEAKLCGILIEADRAWFRIGVGLNLRHTAVPQATSLETICAGAVPTAEDARAAVERGFRLMLGGDRWHGLVSRRLAWRGLRVSVDGCAAPMSGVLAGIDSDGALLLEAPGGGAPRRITSGTLRRESS